MRVVVAGGSGFLGTALVRALRGQGHPVVVLTRQPRQQRPDEIAWAPGERAGGWMAAVRAADVVVNLAGAPLVGPRWSDARKRVILESRLTPTRALAEAILDAPRPPAFLSGSGVGAYGLHGDERLDESSPRGTDFLAEVCQHWEEAANHATGAARVVWLRTGVVLARHGGALPQLARPFWFFVGGSIGSGRQYVSWIHLDDWVALTIWAMHTADVSGPLNVTGPNPVTNAGLSSAIGAALHRPSLMRVPALPVRLALGEMADATILGGQRVVPAKAEALGFRFTYLRIDDALAAIYRRKEEGDRRKEGRRGRT